MQPIKIVGIDPSLRNWGWVHGFYNIENNTVDYTRLGICSTKSDNQNKQVRNNSKDLVRAENIFTKIYHEIKTAKIIFVEVPHGSQTARAMASYGICIGILGSLKAMDINIIEVTANEVKIAHDLPSKTSKSVIIDKVSSKYPHLNWPTYIKDGQQVITKNKAEHMADAIGAVEAGIETNMFKNLLALIN